MRGKLAVSAGGTWPPWTIWVPSALGLTSSALLLMAYAAAGIMSNWDTPAPGRGWLDVGAVGQCGPAGITVVASGGRAAPALAPGMGRHRPDDNPGGSRIARIDRAPALAVTAEAAGRRAVLLLMAAENELVASPVPPCHSPNPASTLMR